MGRFEGMLLVSDYDNTLRHTAALREGRELPPVPPRNIAAVKGWMAEGGRFTLATGRALAAMRPYVGEIPMNAPTVVDNGGAIYDFKREEYLVQRFLPTGAAAHIQAVARAFPALSVELYGVDGTVGVLNPSEWNYRHTRLTGLPFVELADAAQATPPLEKALLLGEPPALRDALLFMQANGWQELYEMIYSSDRLLELTVRGANKGAMVLRLKELCGCGTLYCAGDHLNDLPMLQAADRAFCPANAQEMVRTSGAEVVCHCRDGALADVVNRIAGEILY